MRKYDIFYRERYSAEEPWELQANWDLFLSAYNSSERVRTVFERVRAVEKRWLVHREYGFTQQQFPTNAPVFTHHADNESDFLLEFFEGSTPIDLSGRSLCVDITGFMRPHLMFLMRYLSYKNVPRLDVLYTEPVQYAALHKTTFAKGMVGTVRQVAGFQGQHAPSSQSQDLLIIGSGYEHELIKHIAESKVSARKLQVFGFPPLQPDFYQEGILQAELAAEAVSPTDEADVYFAPAYDPFETAAVLSDIVEVERSRRSITNLYLSPLATRAQALGFALYYLYECQNQAASIIYPFAVEYAQDTASGVSRVWRYTVELPQVPLSNVATGASFP